MKYNIELFENFLKEKNISVNQFCVIYHVDTRTIKKFYNNEKVKLVWVFRFCDILDVLYTKFILEW